MAAADLLSFYVSVANYQASSLQQRDRAAVRQAAPGLLLEALEPARGATVQDFLAWLPRVAPSRLADAARALSDAAPDVWREAFDAYRLKVNDEDDGLSEITRFALEAVIQPVAEMLASTRADSSRASAESSCPACGRPPVVAALREEGHGSRRVLVCGLCFTEWNYLRLGCAACGEQQFESLPVFTADQFPHVRLDACDSCRRYIKTVDLTKDGRAVPLVDDIATLSLDLWAADHGYTRLRAGLLRV